MGYWQDELATWERTDFEGDPDVKERALDQMVYTAIYHFIEERPHAFLQDEDELDRLIAEWMDSKKAVMA